MKISLNTVDLKSALKNAARVIERKATIPVFSGAPWPRAKRQLCGHVLLELESSGIRISATDLEISRQEIVPYAQKIGPMGAPTEWQRAVDCRALFALLPTTVARIKAAPTVDLTADPYHDDGVIHVDVGGSETMIRTLPAKDFPILPFAAPRYTGKRPTWPTSELPDPAVIAGEDFRGTVEKVISAISTEDSRFQLSGALFELREDSLRMVATDGHRLNRAETSFRVSPDHMLRPSEDPNPKVLVPRKMLASAIVDSAFGAIRKQRKVGVYKSGPRKGQDKMQAVQSWPDVHITTTDVHVHMESSRGVRYVARILEGCFPDYDRVIKEDAAELTITTTAEDLRAALASVSHMTGDRARAIRLDLAGDLPVFSAANPDRGTAESTLNGRTTMAGRMGRLENQAESDRVESFGLNPDYLSQAIKPFGADSEIELSLWDSCSQFVVRSGEDTSFRAVIMPVRL